MLSPELETAIRHALDDATKRGHEFSGLEHLLLALMVDDKTGDVIKHCGGSIARLIKKLETFLDEEIKPLPEEDRERAQPTLAFARVVQRAVNHVLGAGKEQANGPNVLVALFSEPESNAVAFLKEEGITRLDVVSYISHGICKLLPAKTGVPGDGGNAGRRRAGRAAGRSAGPVRGQPERAGAGRRDRSADRAQVPDRAGAARAGAAAEEQPAVRRRRGRRQDGHRRGAGAADRARRGAGGAGGRDDLRARHGGDGGGDALPRRLRGAVQGGAQGAGREGERHRLHRRAAHHRRRGRGVGRGDGRLEPDQAGAGQRQAPLHRHDDAQGVPQLHREGPGAGAAVPADRGRGADDRGDDQGPVGAARALRGVPRRHLHRQVAARGGRAVVALPQRPAAARQGDRPHRRGGRGGQAQEGQRDGQRGQAARSQQGHRGGAGDHGPHPGAHRGGRRSRAAGHPGERPQGQDLRPGRGRRARRAGDQDEPRRPRPAAAADRRLPLRRADRRRQDRARQAARRDAGRAVPALRHVGVHGAAHGVAPHRRAARLRRVRPGRSA